MSERTEPTTPDPSVPESLQRLAAHALAQAITDRTGRPTTPEMVDALEHMAATIVDAMSWAWSR